MSSLLDNLYIEPTCILVVNINGYITYASINKELYQELINALNSQPLVLYLHDYDNFVKSSDSDLNIKCEYKDIETKPGDIILFDNNQIGICYDKRLCHAIKLSYNNNISKEKLISIFGNSEICLKLYLEWSE